MALCPDDLVIFYGKEDPSSCRRIDFSSVNEDSLKHLSDTCDRATFGRAQQDVYDETYRKAGKLDTAFFATKYDIERSGLMNAIRYDLLEGHDCNRPMKVELYKLNVYGKDSFFKSHKDTPRSTTMFGSLVVILPTLGVARPSFAHSAAKTLPANRSLVGKTLEILLQDKTFFPNGGYIGFGLRHEYPIELKPKDTKTLEFLEQNLKGCDAMVMQACKDLNLKSSLQICYDGDSYCTDEILVTQEADVNGRYLFDNERPLGGYLTNEYNAKVIKRCRDCIAAYGNREFDFECSRRTGTQFRLNYVYGSFCLIVQIGPPDERGHGEMQ
ncbi:hypothetical protein ACEPAH_9026 [Sanghuangporus vaninii]